MKTKSHGRAWLARTSMLLLTGALSFGLASIASAQATRQIDRAAIQRDQLNAPRTDWYQGQLRKFDPAQFNAPGRVIAVRNNNLGRTEVVENHNPVKAARNAGAPTVTARDDRVCDVQPMALDYLQQERFNLYALRPTTVYPGSFVNLQTLLQPTPQFYDASNRAPYEVVIDISSPKSNAPVVTRVTSNFSRDPTDTLLHPQLRDRHFGAPIPANVFLSVREVRSELEARAALDATVGVMLPLEQFGIPLNISQGGSFSGSVATNRQSRTYMLQFVQPMYAYRMTENDRNRLFTTAGEAARHQNAAYVESVIYGRRLVVIARSFEDETTVRATVAQRLGIGFTGGELAGGRIGTEVDAQAQARFANQILSFEATVFGGSATSNNTIITDPDFVRNYLADASARTLSASTREVPIAYQLQKLSTGNVMIGVRSTGNFNAESCVEPVYKVDVEYRGLKVYKVVEGPGDDAEDIFGTAMVFRSGAPQNQRRRIINIPENQAISIRQGQTSRAIERVTIADNMTLSQMRDMFVEFAPDLKDWEPLHKPQFRARQPADLKLDMRSRLSQFSVMRQGATVTLDNGVRELRLFENADPNGASVAILYQVLVQRK